LPERSSAVRAVTAINSEATRNVTRVNPAGRFPLEHAVQNLHEGIEDVSLDKCCVAESR